MPPKNGLQAVPAHVREVWPMGGPVRGGTQVWMLMRGASPAPVKFSILHGDEPLMLLAAKNATFFTSSLMKAVTPALPTGMHSSAEARVWAGIGSSTLIQRLSTLPGLNTFVYWSDA